MSDTNNRTPNKSTKLLICIFPAEQSPIDSLTKSLNSDCYETIQLKFFEELIDFIKCDGGSVDCLILLRNSEFDSILQQLSQLNILLPIVIVELTEASNTSGGNLGSTVYHSAEIRLFPVQFEQINTFINLAISRFLHLTPSCSLSDRSVKSEPQSETREGLTEQQRRLTEKLKQRFGYLGVYYNRNSQEFYRHLSEPQKEALLQELVADYSQIILGYFTENSQVDRHIDRFVNRAFFADISVSQILEIHVELIDEFSQQLKAEGRNEEILLDYRLALIDTIANLCEMYRRSIPRDDVALELLFGVE